MKHKFLVLALGILLAMPCVLRAEEVEILLIDGSQYVNQIGNDFSICIPSNLTLYMGSTEMILPEGTYPFLQIEDGYVVDIN